MHVSRIQIDNFRGISHADLLLPQHGVFIGDNNTGKTTILEALDLVLGPDRLNRRPPIDEHDFYLGRYVNKMKNNVFDDGQELVNPSNTPEVANDAMTTQPIITIEVTIIELNEEQKAKFGDYIEFWNSEAFCLFNETDIGGVDASQITEALRITFLGHYDQDEDDFEGRTYFSRSLSESDRAEPFTSKHKQYCGFLYLRSLRTGSRALSLERGSLLDIILKLKEVRPQMWEETLNTLAGIPVASAPELGITPILESINVALKKYVPKEWGINPHLRVSNLTREHLRKVITAFIATGDGDHSAPFYRQGTGTVNMLVLALLSQIAEGKQNVIFAMEEPETAVPPYAQKRIVHEIRKLASQAIFTSHSPYVLEEFELDETIILHRDTNGKLSRQNIVLPDNVKPKRYRQEFRTRFCEGLLSRRILIAEGITEASAFPVACRRLEELNPSIYASLEALGICVIDADGENNIAGMAQLYRSMGKNTYAICDKQDDYSKTLIEAQVDLLLMHDKKGFETLILDNTTDEALARFIQQIEWPQHLKEKYPTPETDAKNALSAYFTKTKGCSGIADFIVQCTESEIPEWIRQATQQLKHTCVATSAVDETVIIANDFTTPDPDNNESD